jgi:hypothetical protein
LNRFKMICSSRVTLRRDRFDLCAARRTGAASHRRVLRSGQYGSDLARY